MLQVAVTSRIHRSLGLAFALMLLPVALGSTAIIVPVTGAYWAPQAARVFDSTLRSTVDKTSRVLFLPMASELKYRIKPFIDVTMDRIAAGVTAVIILVLIQPGIRFRLARAELRQRRRHGVVDRDGTPSPGDST